MLSVHTSAAQAASTWAAGDRMPADVIWFDLCDASAAEIDAVQSATGLQLPSSEHFRTIGLAGRNRGEGREVRLHLTRFHDSGDDNDSHKPLGLVLTPDVLVTQRYGDSVAFGHAATQLDNCSKRDSAVAFVILIESITSQIAESMQDVAGELADLSTDVFVSHRLRTRTLRNMMLRVGKLETRLTRSRATLLGVDRVVTYLCERKPEWLPDGSHQQLRSVDNDLSMLDEFDDHLTGKVQFLLDAILGFINTDQNEVMKLLTVASVVTIPPVILAGIWGMNFKHMPELKWYFGYPLALSALFISIVIPLLWFKYKGWLSKD